MRGTHGGQRSQLARAHRHTAASPFTKDADASSVPVINQMSLFAPREFTSSEFEEVVCPLEWLHSDRIQRGGQSLSVRPGSYQTYELFHCRFPGLDRLVPGVLADHSPHLVA